jgi:hypothetical protein
LSLQPHVERLDAELEELGVAANRDTRRLLALLATDPHALYTCLSRLSELELPAQHLPPVDQLVAQRLASGFPRCSEPAVLRKTKPMSGQCRRLLAMLLRDLGTPVPLPELLLGNALRSGTPRRLRELQTEHGAFRIRTFSKDGIQHYVLEHPEPDVEACCRYWIRSNLRNSDLSSERRVLGLLSAELGQPVPKRHVDYVLPEVTSPGRGRARESSGAGTAAVAALVARGYAIEQRPEGVVLLSLEPAR